MPPAPTAFGLPVPLQVDRLIRRDGRTDIEVAVGLPVLRCEELRDFFVASVRDVEGINAGFNLYSSRIAQRHSGEREG